MIQLRPKDEIRRVGEQAAVRYSRALWQCRMVAMLACFTVPLLYDDEALLAALAAGGIVIGMFVPVRIKTALLLPAIFTAIVVGAWASLVCLLLAAFVGYGFSAYIIWKNRHQLFEKREDSE